MQSNVILNIRQVRVWFEHLYLSHLSYFYFDWDSCHRYCCSVEGYYLVNRKMDHFRILRRHNHLRRRNHNYYLHNHPHLRNLRNPHFPPSSKTNYQFNCLIIVQWSYNNILHGAKFARGEMWRFWKAYLLTVGVSFQIHSFPFHSYSALILVTRTRSIPDMRHNRCEVDNFILINFFQKFFYINTKSRSCL